MKEKTKMILMKAVNDRIKHSESGSVVIEATLALPLFMFGFLFILSFITIIRAERAVQLGIDKAASEIAAYCCLAGDTEICENELFEKTAEQICRVISSEKIRENDRYGILNKTNGFSVNDIDFSGSDILPENDKIIIQAEYEVTPWIFGLFSKKNMVLKMKNSAVTFAFTGNKENSEDDTASVWRKLPFIRGAEWIRTIKAENSDMAVKRGYGIDLYSEDTGKMSQVFSVNLFSETYSKKNDPSGNKPEFYTIKENNVESLLRGYASELLRNTDKYGDKVYKHMEKGTGKKCEEPTEKPEMFIIVPEEAGQNSEMKNTFEKIVSEVSERYGISGKTVYREKALKGGDK